MYDVMISSPDMFGGTKKFHVWWDCDFQVERLLCSWWTCEWAKPSAGGLFHRSGWSFSTWIERCPIAVPHLLEGYKKARKVLMRMPKLQQMWKWPWCRVRAHLGCGEGLHQLTSVALWHLETFRTIPALAEGSEPSHPVTAQFYKDIHWQGRGHQSCEGCSKRLDCIVRLWTSRCC